MTKAKEKPVYRHQPTTWPDGSYRSTKNGFVLGFGDEAGFDAVRLELDAANSRRSAKRVASDLASGIARGRQPGISRKANERLATHGPVGMMRRAKA